MTKLDKFRVSVLVGACVFLGGGWVVRAHAAEGTCQPLADIKASLTAHHASWTTLSAEQFQFMRGISVMAPSAPSGVPYGDRAALVRFADEKGGVVVFVDGDKGCEPLPIPADLIAMLMDLGTVQHEGLSQ